MSVAGQDRAGPAADGPLRAWLDVGPRRSLALMGVGAAAGLLIAGFGLFTAKGSASGGLPPEDLALVNGRPILRSDFVAQSEQLYGRPFGRTTAAQRRRVVDDMIREELFVQRGLELDLGASDPDVRSALVAGVERQVEADVTAKTPSDEELRRFYADHRADYASEGTMTLLDLTPKPGVAPDPARLPRAAAALGAGGRPETVAAAFDLADQRRSQGEEFYFAARLHLGPVLFDLARRLKPGQAFGPATVAGTPHILVMRRNASPVPLSFEEARDRLVQDYDKAARRRIEAGDLAYLKRKAEIVLAPDYR